MCLNLDTVAQIKNSLHELRVQLENIYRYKHLQASCRFMECALHIYCCITEAKLDKCKFRNNYSRKKLQLILIHGLPDKRNSSVW